MEPWEVAIAAAIQPNKVHIGVYGAEVEAARAYDRALVLVLGIDAAIFLNFELVDYLDALSKFKSDKIFIYVANCLFKSASYA